MDFFFVLFWTFIGFIVHTGLCYLFALTGAFYRTWCFKAVKVFLFSSYVACLSKVFLSHSNLVLFIVKVILISLWVALFFNITSAKSGQQAKELHNSTAYLSHSREAVIAYFYSITIPLMVFFTQIIPPFLRTFWTWVISGISLVSQSNLMYYIFGILGIVAFLILTPLIQLFTATLIGWILKIFKKDS